VQDISTLAPLPPVISGSPLRSFPSRPSAALSATVPTTAGFFLRRRSAPGAYSYRRHALAVTGGCAPADHSPAMGSAALEILKRRHSELRKARALFQRFCFSDYARLRRSRQLSVVIPNFVSAHALFQGFAFPITRDYGDLGDRGPQTAPVLRAPPIPRTLRNGGQAGWGGITAIPITLDLRPPAASPARLCASPACAAFCSRPAAPAEASPAPPVTPLSPRSPP
jgi:hypothetical protein